MSLHHDMESFEENFNRGRNGKNLGIPMGFRRLSKCIGLRRGVYYLIGGYTGCLSGDTIIHVARKQKTANTKVYRLDYLYMKLHQRGGKDAWDKSLPTRVKVYMPDKGQTSVHLIEDVVYSGVKPVFQVRTAGGLTIKATANHKFMITEDGTFKKLCDLRPGDNVVVKCEKQSRANGRKLKHRKETCGKYPYYWGARKRIINGRTYQRIYDYRIAYDAGINNMSVEEFLHEVATNRRHKLILSNSRWVVHHIDENPLNNEFSNLELMSKREHDRLHAKTSNYGHSWVKLDTIESITPVGAEPTFDIYCADPYHNFLANDFVVHNSGKTTLLDDAFVLNPCEWYLKNRKTTDIDLKIIYFSMERKKDLKIARWISRLIFLNNGIIVPIDSILGWNEVPSNEIVRLVEREKTKINELLEDVIILHEDPINPTGVYHFLKEFAEERGGKEEEIEIKNSWGGSRYKKVWKPSNPNEIVLVITDHIGLARSEKSGGRQLTDKEVLDKYSEYMRLARDYYNYSPVVLSQFNRDIANPIRIKNGDVEPMLEDFKGSGDSQEDAEVVLSLFDPMRYKVADPSGYNLEKLKDEQKRKKYRSLKILKNSYGPDDVRIGLAYQPEVGIFKEMPKLSEVTEDTYKSIIRNDYFFPD